MFNRNKSKRHDIKKTVKSAVKEEIKNTVKSTLVQDFLDYSAKTIETNDKIESDLYIKNNVKLHKGRPFRLRRNHFLADIRNAPEQI